MLISRQLNYQRLVAFKAGNTTFIIGIADDRVGEVLKIIKETSQTRQQFMTPPVNLDATSDSSMAYPVEVQVGGAPSLSYRSKPFIASLMTKVFN